MLCSMGMFIPPEDRVSKEGFIVKALCMPSLEEWMGFIHGTRRKGIPGKWMSTNRSLEGGKGMRLRFTQKQISHNECVAIKLGNY